MNLLSQPVSLRIQKLIDLVPYDVEEIWDICCDHGIFGRYFLFNSCSHLKKVHFLDQVPGIMEKLERVTQSESNGYQSSFQLHQGDGRVFTFPAIQAKTLFCIAGVGSVTITKILNAISLNKNLAQAYLLIGSHKQTFSLRQTLKALQWKMVEEKIVAENGKFREIWLLAKVGEEISDTGNPKCENLDTWLAYWNENFERIQQIEKKGGQPEVSSKKLLQAINKFS